jgi:hypothetical protein
LYAKYKKNLMLNNSPLKFALKYRNILRHHKYIENDPYLAFLSTPTCSVGSDVLNGWPGVTGRRGQKGAVGIIFDMFKKNV